VEKILIDLKKSLKEIAGDRLIKMVLYGSRARGDYSEDSDTDVAIVVRGLSREMKHHMLSRVADIEFEYLRSLSTLILSEEDFILLKARERRIAADIEREGIPIGREITGERIFAPNLKGRRKLSLRQHSCMKTALSAMPYRDCITSFCIMSGLSCYRKIWNRGVTTGHFAFSVCISCVKV
jgi:predicted nucleotidyltransferase